MADASLNCIPRIREAFWHERLGAVLMCDVITVINGQPGEVLTLFDLRTPCDGDPVYLEAVSAHLRAHWSAACEQAHEPHPDFSAN